MNPKKKTKLERAAESHAAKYGDLNAGLKVARELAYQAGARWAFRQSVAAIEEQIVDFPLSRDMAIAAVRKRAKS